ncbi:unnamed protein product [Phytophthora lilii]|uniref:Unnamed protein product n=1 Tax=Phytophthora lilii TaxID=2077276 RepID=A0A9W6WNE4_9STRA|nr:unnamed protein product [Phytophthora lilii]
MKPVEPTDQAVAVFTLQRMLKEAGIVSGNFDAEKMLELDLPILEDLARRLGKLLTPLLDRAGQVDAWAFRSSYVGTRKKEADLAPVTTAATSTENSGRLQSFFNAAKERFQNEQEAAAAPAPREPNQANDVGAEDVEMESVRSDQDDPDEHDPDDLSIDVPPVAAVSSTDAMQEHDGKMHPVRSLSRVLKEAEIKYYLAEKRYSRFCSSSRCATPSSLAESSPSIRDSRLD